MEKGLEAEEVQEPGPVYGVPDRTDYAVQANIISRASYRMPVMARRLLFMAAAQVQINYANELWVEMSVGDVVRALNLDDGAKNYHAIRDAVREAASQNIEFEELNGDWYVHPWIDYAQVIKKTDRIRIRFAREMRQLLLEMKRDFALLDLSDYAELQGRYSQRIYEIVMADSGHAGKGGNPPRTWWVRVEKNRLRKMLGIRETEYRTTADLRKRVIETPVREINEAQIGIRIDVQYQRKGRQIQAFKFLVEKVPKGSPRKVSPASEGEREEQALIDANREIWEECFEQARKQEYLALSSKKGMREASIRAEAWQLFSERTDIVKPRRR